MKRTFTIITVLNHHFFDRDHLYPAILVEKYDPTERRTDQRKSGKGGDNSRRRTGAVQRKLS